jgi:V/A-type H+-transporting ATPase subunit A
VVKLVGADVLPDSQRLVLETAKIFKNAFLQQNAFDEVDAFCVAEKQYRMLKIIVSFFNLGSEAIKKGGTLVGLIKLKVMRDIMRMKFEYSNEDAAKLEELQRKLEESIHEFGSIFG